MSRKKTIGALFGLGSIGLMVTGIIMPAHPITGIWCLALSLLAYVFGASIAALRTIRARLTTATALAIVVGCGYWTVVERHKLQATPPNSTTSTTQATSGPGSVAVSGDNNSVTTNAAHVPTAQEIVGLIPKQQPKPADAHIQTAVPVYTDDEGIVFQIFVTNRGDLPISKMVHIASINYTSGEIWTREREDEESAMLLRMLTNTEGSPTGTIKTGDRIFWRRYDKALTREQFSDLQLGRRRVYVFAAISYFDGQKEQYGELCESFSGNFDSGAVNCYGHNR